MARYRKKPVEIEAVQVRAADFNGRSFDGCPFSELPAWLDAAMDDERIRAVFPEADYAVWSIDTLEGTMRAEPGDYIIRGVKGELYPCKSDIFEATYDAVE